MLSALWEAAHRVAEMVVPGATMSGLRRLSVVGPMLVKYARLSYLSAQGLAISSSSSSTDWVYIVSWQSSELLTLNSPTSGAAGMNNRHEHAAQGGSCEAEAGSGVAVALVGFTVMSKAIHLS